MVSARSSENWWVRLRRTQDVQVGGLTARVAHLVIIDRGRVGSFGVPGRRMYVVGSPARTGLAGRAVDLPICLRGDAFACWVSSVTGPNANPSKRRSRKLTEW